MLRPPKHRSYEGNVGRTVADVWKVFLMVWGQPGRFVGHCLRLDAIGEFGFRV